MAIVRSQTNAVVKSATLVRIVTSAIHTQAAKMERVDALGNVTAGNVFLSTSAMFYMN